MVELGRRVNSIIVKNLPTDYNETHLEELFSKFGRVLSTKVLTANANFDGGCGFVNFADPESCIQAVEMMDNLSINGFILRVSHSMTRLNGNHSANSCERTSNGLRVNGDSYSRTTSSLDGSQGAASPIRSQRFASFRPASERSSKGDNLNSSTYELDNGGTQSKPLWNSQAEPMKNQSPIRSEIPLSIAEHEPLVKSSKYYVYLSNLEVPNVIFAATLDDYLNATMLINEMNKHEQLNKVQPNGYKNKLSVGQYCAALFGGDWYRARVVEIEEQRVLVQYIDWGNSNWCDSILEIRPLPNEFYKHSILCVKCILDGVPVAKPNEEQTNIILTNILVLDTKLEMTVVNLENGIPHVQLALAEKNLNQAIRALFVSSPVPEPIVFDQQKPVIKLSEMHQVQLTTVDPDGQCFHVLLFGEPMTRILNVLKDWKANKQPLKSSPKVNTLVCAQYEDGLWYRAWIASITEKGYEVYFVDFGNEETVSIDLLTECPDSIRLIPWRSIQVKFHNIQMDDDERYLLLRKYDTQQLDMKVLHHEQDVYSVELFYNGKSITDPIVEARQRKIVIKEPVVAVRPTPTPTPTPTSAPTPTPMVNGNARPQIIPTTPVQVSAPISKPLTTVTPTAPTNGLHEDNFSNLIQEQRRQNRLLEQVIAGINTTNALLAQLVQSSSI